MTDPTPSPTTDRERIATALELIAQAKQHLIACNHGDKETDKRTTHAINDLNLATVPLSLLLYTMEKLAASKGITTLPNYDALFAQVDESEDDE